MKIGIVTPYDSANCGAYLQAYANKCFLEKNNYNVCFIQWRNEKQRKKEYFSKPKTIKELIRCIQRYPFLCVRYKRMTQALKEFDIQKNTGDLDCTVVGSDEIWNIKVSQFQNPIFYGGVEQKSCIAYAPSAGQAALKDYNDFPWVRECLEKMTYAGVRDDQILILMYAMLFRVLVGLYSCIYVAQKNAKKIAYTSISAAIINITVNLILINKIKIFAASISTLVAFFSMFIIRYIDVNKTVHMRIRKPIIIGSILIGTMLIGTYYCENKMIQFIALCITAIYAVLTNVDMLKSGMKLVKSRFGK